MESHETPTTPRRPSVKANRRRRPILVGVVVLVLAGGISWWLGLGSYLSQRVRYAGRTSIFSGGSESLKQTVIVPTLDTPSPPGKNVIWCSSFQLAWNEIRDKLIGAPLTVVGAEEVAARLNTASQSGSDLEPASFYAVGGRVKDGLIDKIKKDMAAKFPSHTAPDFAQHTREPNGILAYSYLTANVPFPHPFRQGKVAFGTSRGQKTKAEAFGVWGYMGYDEIRDQVEVLYCRLAKDWSEVRECALDLYKESRPYQVVVAIVERKGSLDETLQYVRQSIADYPKSFDYEQHNGRLSRVDCLVVPEMFWKIDHRFRELLGKVVDNVDLPIVEAMQTIEFRLDRCGAVLETEASVAVKAIPRYFIFDRPFLIYMQKRGAEHPFFIMWVDNAELLTRK